MYECVVCNVGDLLPRHIEIFSRNPFFRGMSIPEPELVVSIIVLC